VPRRLRSIDRELLDALGRGARVARGELRILYASAYIGGTMAAPGVASGELRELALATQRRTRDHLAAAVQITEETAQVGASTLEELARQGEAIDRTHRKVDELQAQSQHASFLLTGIRSVFGSIRNKFSRQPKDPKAAADAAASVRAARRAQAAQAAGRPAPDPTSFATGRGSATVGVGAAAGADRAGSPAVLAVSGQLAAAHADEDALLAVISANVDRIGHMGREMGAELGRQDRQLDELVGAVHTADAQLAANAKLARKLAK
jgi:hypothetical protein